MGRVLNLMAFVVFATSLFMRSVDPVIPQIASDLNVAPTTAALLSTAFTLPYALVQPVLGRNDCSDPHVVGTDRTTVGPRTTSAVRRER